MNKIILASGSPRRRELLEQIGIPFEVVTSNAAEVTSAVQPDEIVKELSKIKAEAVKQLCKEKGETYQDAVILGADTIVYHNGKVLGKPKSEEDAYSMIESLAGKEHFVYTGVTILTPKKQICFAEAVKVSVYEMSAEEIKRYIATGEPMDKAVGTTSFSTSPVKISAAPMSAFPFCLTCPSSTRASCARPSSGQ